MPPAPPAIDSRSSPTAAAPSTCGSGVGGERQRVVLHERPGCPCGCGGGWDEQRGARTSSATSSRACEPASGSRASARRRRPCRRTCRPSTRTRRRGCTRRSRASSATSRSTTTPSGLPLAAHPAPPAVLRQAPPRRDRPRPLPGLQGAQAAGVGRAAGGASRPAPTCATATAASSSRSAPSSIRKLIDTLAAILDEAVEDGLIERNPARGKRMKVRVPKPPRTFLEMDELAALLEAAEDQDRSPLLAVPIGPASRTRDQVARLAAAGKRPSAIAAELGLAKSTVTHHLRQPRRGERRRLHRAARDRRDARRAAACGSASSATSGSATSGCTTRTARASASPTPRPKPASATSQMTPDLVERPHRAPASACARRATRPGPTTTCSRTSAAAGSSRQRVGKILREAATLASERLAERGPAAAAEHDAAHDAAHLHLDRAARQRLRRQVGHEPGRPRRLEDDDGRLRAARAARRPLARHRLRRPASRGEGQREDVDWATIGPREPEIAPRTEPPRTRKRAKKKPADAGLREWRDPDSNRGHHDFQSCALPTELSRRARTG